MASLETAYRLQGSVGSTHGIMLPVDPAGFVLVTKDGTTLREVDSRTARVVKIPAFEGKNLVAFRADDLLDGEWLVGTVKEILHGCVAVITGNNRETYALSLMDDIHLLEAETDKITLTSKYPYRLDELKPFLVK